MATKSYPGVEVHRGRIRVYFSWRLKRVKEPIGLLATPANLKHAARMVKEIQEEIRAGVFQYATWFPDSPRAGSDDCSIPTFNELADRWVRDLVGLSPSTILNYEKILDGHYRPDLGDTKISLIRYDQVAEIVNGYPWRTVKTRNNALTPLRGVFELAIAEGYIEVNPVTRLRKLKHQKPEPDPFTLDEAEVILHWLWSHRPECMWNYYEFAFFSGLRTSELIAIRWEDVDFHAGYVRVQRSKVVGQVKNTTKTYSIRDVDLNDRSREALRRQKAITFLADGEVFLDPLTDKPFVGDKPPRLHFDAALKATGIRRRIPYQCRHTYATLCLMAGANVLWVSRQLGHSNMKTTLDKYARWIDGADKGAERAKVNAYFSDHSACLTNGASVKVVPKLSPEGQDS